MTDDRFDWSPEPELIDVRDPDRSRAALEALGEATWREALDWLYGEALRRPMHAKHLPGGPRGVLRAERHARRPRPMSPSPWDEVLAEFRARVAPATFNAQHPGSFSYFTPPPLPMSIAGEVLAQWIHQGVDVWHAGPDRRVRGGGGHRLAPRPRRASATTAGACSPSGGVMANIMAMTVARDIWLPTLRGLGRRPARRGARGRPRLRERPGPLLDRAGARRARASPTRRCA